MHIFIEIVQYLWNRKFTTLEYKSRTPKSTLYVQSVLPINVSKNFEDEGINLKIYEINNRRLHSVHNAGDAARVHLILDYVLKGEKCCCGEKHHPDQPCMPEACMDTDHGRIPCTCHTESA